VETSLHELAVTLGTVMGVDLEPEYGPARKATPVFRRLADTKKAERMLGFKTRVPLQEGLRRLVEWWSKETKTPVCGTQAFAPKANGGFVLELAQSR